jgi:2-dehydro-3-deoxyphosphogluconate aldolase / (4S)-4-hydroxy-2-oxoglutarate aldolase
MSASVSSGALQLILQNRIVAILRGCDPEQIVPVASALYEGGVRALEVTLNSDDAFGAIEELSDRLGDRLLIGAGTVLDAAEATSAIAAGARFIISPSLDVNTIRRTLDLGVLSIPGAFTATEILTAYRFGAGIVKVFPASIGPAYFRDLRGPFPQIPLMATGGVGIDNILAFHRAGVAAFGIGGGLLNPAGSPGMDYLERLTAAAKAFVSTLNSPSP